MSLDNIIHGVDRLKRRLEPGIDKVLATAAVNVGAVYGASEVIDRSDFSDPTNALIMMGTGAALTAGNFLAFSNKGRRFRNFVGRINNYLDRVRPVSWVKTTALAGALAFCANAVYPYVQQIVEDFTDSIGKDEVTLVSPTVSRQPTRNRPAIYDSLSYTTLVEHNFNGVNLADKNTTIGRIQRTLRWQPIYRTIEEVYGIPRDTLAGMIMQESYGDPVQPNAGDDGGLGLTHIQGTTARQYGLRIFGNSGRDSDRRHGRQIRQVLEECNYDPACVQKEDDRAHLVKVLDAAARIVSEGREKHGSWDKGVEYYRAPGKVGRHTTWAYLQDVKKWRGAIRNKNKLREAAEDFERRNNYAFDSYTSRWCSMAGNWGLKAYRTAMH